MPSKSIQDLWVYHHRLLLFATLRLLFVCMYIMLNGIATERSLKGVNEKSIIKRRRHSPTMSTILGKADTKFLKKNLPRLKCKSSSKAFFVVNETFFFEKEKIEKFLHERLLQLLSASNSSLKRRRHSLDKFFSSWMSSTFSVEKNRKMNKLCSPGFRLDIILTFFSSLFLITFPFVCL